MNCVFWQNMPTHHQAPWLKALAGHPGVAVWVAIEAGIPAWRRDTGWEVPDYGSAIVTIGLPPSVSRRIIDDAGPDAIHVFSGLGAYPALHQAFIACAGAGRRIGVMAESGSETGNLRFLRTVAGKIKYYRFGRHVQFVLAIGESGPKWFTNVGFQSDRVFEFAYFPPVPGCVVANESIWPSSKVRLLYIGQLIRRKGIDRLLCALAKVAHKEWHLILVGSGDREPVLKVLTARLGLHDRVRFCGMAPNPEAMSVLEGADILVLPSMRDGYGAVVNEALLRGVPVICSDQCGAQQAVKVDPAMGTVHSSFDSLLAALEQWISRGRRSAESVRKVRDLATCLHPEAGAQYFIDIMEHLYGGRPRPDAPWRMRRGLCQETRP
jgi:glycosyltransferase involved in cell wall biosynthesis